jgi:hypothetical protein
MFVELQFPGTMDHILRKSLASALAVVGVCGRVSTSTVMSHKGK